MKKLFFAISILFLSSLSFARSHSSSYDQPQWSWDLGAAAGTYSGYSYSEIDLGLNDRFVNYLNWRNVLWDRFGSSSAVSALGLDSSLRYEFTDFGDSGAGFRFFAGPGLRISNAQYTGLFAEGGILFHMSSFNLGFGVKAIRYSSPGTDPSTGAPFPSTDFMYFIILSGGGAL
jgi:hypothetical protein